MKTIDMDDTQPSRGGGGPRRPNSGMPAGIGGIKNIFMIAVTVVAVLMFLGLAMSGNLGVVNVSTEQMAVKVNYITGEKEIINSAGFKVYIPFMQEIFILDRTPQKFLMIDGGAAMNDSYGPPLSVRASDGSNFGFDELEIHYSIIPGMADEIIEDSGVGDGYKRDWLRGYARSILRDEFGRFSAVEVADPSSYKMAQDQSMIRLNELLNPHGIRVQQIVAPKPRFDPMYEKAIADRKVADQEVERLRVKESKLAEERLALLAEVEKQKEIEWAELQGDLKRLELEAEREAILITKGADRYKVTREAQGQQELDKSMANARGLVAKYTKEAEGIRARTEALESRGRVIVREALIDKLASIRFTLIPYSRDAMPKRLEHSGLNSEVARSGSLSGGGQ